MTARLFRVLLGGIILLILGGIFWVNSSQQLEKNTAAPVEDTPFAVDTQHTGQIRHWKVGEKVLVDASADTTSPLRLQMSDGKILEFRPTGSEQKDTEDGRFISVRGRFGANEDGWPASIRYDVSPDHTSVKVTFRVEAPADRFSSWDWQLPLALAPRKRVYFRGENGLDWDTRYFYQLVAKGNEVLAHPDRNEWRWFGLDQMTPHAFRLWKAESEEVSALVMQEGENIPPFVQLYNIDGGLTVEYPALAQSAPAGFLIDAAGGAVAAVKLSSAQLGQEQTILLNASRAEADVIAQREILQQKYPTERRIIAEEVLQEPQWLQQTPIASVSPIYVTGGYPFAQGELRDLNRLAVSVSGVPVPLQGRILGYWPDGSAKWVLLTFPIQPSQAVADCPAPRVSLRNGKYIPVQIEVKATPSPMPSSTLQTQTQDDGSVEISQGAFRVRMTKGREWLAVWQGDRPVIAPDLNNRLAYVDYLSGVQRAVPFQNIWEGGELSPGTLNVTQIRVEESGPLRTVVRLAGMAGEKERTRIVLRLRFEAGRPEIHLTHTAEFLFQDPRRTFLQDLGLALPFSGALTDVRFAGTDADHVTGLLQETPFARFSEKDGRKTPAGGHGGWIEAKTGGIQFLGLLRNFRETAPKAIEFAPDGRTVKFALWPKSAGPMDVRRYSNYPHLSQGEAVPTNEDWVESYYYTTDPFVGITRTHEMLLGFWPQGSAPVAEQAAADFQSPPLLYAGWERYNATGVVLPQPTQAEWPRAWEAWTRLATFWLYHRDLHTWYGFWHYGDFRHYFRDGYGWNFPPEILREYLATKNPELLKGKQVQDYLPPNDWAYDNGRWGWTNSEGLPNLFLQQEYLRHGNRVVYFAAEAMARFARDVVIRHDGKWLGAGTRHGVQHWSDGGHEERQTTSTEFRLHYFLSGEERTRDVAEMLYDKVYTKRPVNVEAQHSGRWGGLLFHQEMTGSPEELAQLKAYARTFLAPEGLYLCPSVGFPGVTTFAPPKNLNGGQMFFHTYGAMHNLLEFQQSTNDPEILTSLLKMADATIANPEIVRNYARDSYSSDGIYFPAVAFAAIHAPNPQPYREFLENWMRGGGWRRLYQTVTHDERHWSGPTASIYGQVPGCFFWTNWAPYVTKALGTDAVWSAEIAKEYDHVEQNGRPRSVVPPSWQLEFDQESLPYLDRQKPWLPPSQNE